MLLLNSTVWKRGSLTSHKILAEPPSHYVSHTSNSRLREAQSLQGTWYPRKKGLYCAVLSHSAVSDSAIPWTVARQTPRSMEILQVRILEWVAMPSSRGSSKPRDQTHFSYVICIDGQVLYHWHHLESPLGHQGGHFLIL